MVFWLWSNPRYNSASCALSLSLSLARFVGQVGEPPLQENGLPAHFTLGSASSHSGHGHGPMGKAPVAAGAGGTGSGSGNSGSGAAGGGCRSSKGGSRSGGVGKEASREPSAAELLRASLPPADRMHVTLFFRSL